jgi:hypothetical protein
MKPIQTKKLVTVDEFCLLSNVETSFVNLLEQSGLIELLVIQETRYVEADQLRQLEKMVRFHYEWDINLEGLETIMHLLQQINTLHDETMTLKNRLRFYE